MVVCALTLAAVGTSCGYRRVDLTQIFPPEVRRIEIHVFENTTLEPGFGTLLSDALVEEFARRGALDPVYAGQGGSADLVMTGAIRRLHVSPSAFSSVSLTLEDTLELEIEVHVVRNGTGEEVWSQPGLRYSERFLSSPDPQVYESNKEQAMRRVTSALAGRIHDELFQTF